MFNKSKAILGALAMLGAIGSVATDSQAGICFSNSSPWKKLYTCGVNGTIDTRDSCSGAVCIARMAVQKNGGFVTKAQGLDINGNNVVGCFAQDTVADGVPVVKNTQCFPAKAVKYEVTF